MRSPSSPPSSNQHPYQQIQTVTVGGAGAVTRSPWLPPLSVHPNRFAVRDPFPTMHVRQTIRHDHAELDAKLRRATNGRLCVETYRAIRWAAQLSGAAIVAATWFLPNVEPSQTAFLVFAALILGPSVVEAYLTR